MAQKVSALLKDLGSIVEMSRTSDIALSQDVNSDLTARYSMANSFKADAFISIHCNAIGDMNVGGTETYCYSIGSGGEKLARAVHNRLCPATGLKDRGVKTKNLAVLRGTSMPAILIELAFISNPAEEKLLADHVWQDKVAKAIVQGIVDYMPDKFPKRSDVPMGASDWKKKIIEESLINRLILESHDPDETAPKWFVLAVANNILKELKK